MTTEPKIGALYFLVKYADKNMTRPVIGTYEYKGKEPKDADGLEYVFEDISSGDQLILRQRDLWNVVDLPGLIEELKRFHIAGRGGT